MRDIYCELSPDELIALQKKMSNEIVIIKCGAEWCNPCKKIKSVCETNFQTLPENVIIFEIDVDESLDLYATLKTKKMVKGIPCLLCYYGGVSRDQWYIPDDSVSGGNEAEVQSFFNRCAQKAGSMK